MSVAISSAVLRSASCRAGCSRVSRLINFVKVGLDSLPPPEIRRTVHEAWFRSRRLYRASYASVALDTTTLPPERSAVISAPIRCGRQLVRGGVAMCDGEGERALEQLDGAIYVGVRAQE